jgi:hypothetical protein
MRKRRTRRHPTSKIAVTAADTTAASKERHIPAGASKEPAIRLNVLRALDFYHSRVGAGHLGRLSVSALAGAELVGDPTALQDASLYGSDLQITDINDIEDGVGAGDQMVGRITVNGEKVPVFRFQPLPPPCLIVPPSLPTSLAVSLPISSQSPSPPHPPYSGVELPGPGR